MDRMEITQVLFVFPSEKGGGRGLRPTGNTKPEKKLEENRGLVKINLRKTSIFKEFEVFLYDLKVVIPNLRHILMVQRHY